MLSIVVINFFPAFNPPLSGGELRLGNLYRALSEKMSITLITSSDFDARYEEITHTKHFRELRFPKDKLWQEAFSTLERSGLSGELSGLAFALAVSDPDCSLRKCARELSKNSYAVIHEFPFSEPIFNDGCPTMEIYNAHNFEASLLSSIVGGEGLEAALLKLIKLEGNLVARAARVYATSSLDATKFRLFYGVNPRNIDVCPNGFDESELYPVVIARKNDTGARVRRPLLLFTGSRHQPNVEAARFLMTIASDLTDCDILLAGGMCAALVEEELPPNVNLYGPFDQTSKLLLLTEAVLYLNPVIFGSGTSLKALEALGAMLTMVSTEEGVRGLGLLPGVHCEVCPRDGFVGAVRALLKNGTRRIEMASAGHALAVETFSWFHIARNLAISLAQVPAQAVPSAPLLLALNDYSVLHPGSGGTARVRNLLTELMCDVVLLSFGSGFEVSLIARNVLHVTITKTSAHQSFEAAVNDGEVMSVNDAVASLFVATNRTLTIIVAAIAQRAHAVIFEHPYMAPLLDNILLVSPSIPIVYSAHNVEATHKQAILSGHRMSISLVEFIRKLENQLVRHADLIVCCTDADARHFGSTDKQTLVVLNGCSLPDPALVSKRKSSEESIRHRIGFLGSAHGPNAEAAKFIIDTMVPVFPELDFEFIGSVCDTLQGTLPSNVRLHGLMSDEEKTNTMMSWDVALNPVESGGGSSLKLPDYMAHSLPSLSTEFGARGFAILQNNAGWVVGRSEFVSSMRGLVARPELIANARRNAYRYASEKLNWQVVTESYRDFIREIAMSKPTSICAAKILVVTYRYTEPCLGGAEEYLVEVLKRFRPRCERLDLAAISVVELTNRHHYGCSFTTDAISVPRRIGELFDAMYFFAPEKVPELEILNRSRHLERVWSQEEQALFSSFAQSLAKAGRLRLFGGFFGPENHQGVVRRWTSPKFAFLIPADARVFQMSGFASVEKTLRITLMRVMHDDILDAVDVLNTTISPYFSTTLALPASDLAEVLLLTCEVDEHVVSGDHRPLGVLLDLALVTIDPKRGLSVVPGSNLAELTISNADLSEMIEEEIRTNFSEDWIAALHRVAQRRDAAAEDHFAAVRGPHSSALQGWLETHAVGYDTVIVQGIPFDIVPSTVDTLSKIDIRVRPRIVILPHFHSDDRFYHWRRYFKSFARADATLLFSASAAEQLAPKGCFIVVPGGGVRADEYGDLTSESSFRSVHRGTNPFFLVLGRKTASKGYREAMRSHQSLRVFGHAIDLVLIGPDEDGYPVEGDGVFYLGRQPRNVICGALGSCLAVVTMSRSESFGIVLCEAWLFGKPVIASKACCSFRDLIKNEETGLLVTTENELTAAMVRLAQSEDDRNRMGRAGFADVLRNYTWDSVSDACFKAVFCPK